MSDDYVSEGVQRPVLARANGTGYKRFFTKEGEDPYSSVQWERHDAEIKDRDGKIIYSNPQVEFPATWSKNAKRITASKYFYKGDEKQYAERSLRDLFGRVGETISQTGLDQGLFSNPEEAQAFREDLAYLQLHQGHSFNSPVWFNVGLHQRYGVSEKSEESSHWALLSDGSFSNKIDAYARPQGAACFIQSIDDSMESILTHAYKEGMLFKFGSGTGTNFSTLRGINEPLSGGGVASGMLSFMRIYDIIAGRIQSGGKTRRAAKMVICDCDHPDVYRFAHWKVNEEKKALWLSANPVWGPKGSGDLDSEASKTVDGQNGNNSIRVTDDFMMAALEGSDWNLWFRTGDRDPNEVEIDLKDYRDDRQLPDKRFIKRLTNKRKIVNAGELLEQIARAASVTGDPGLQYDTTINKWHTCPNSERINASNPCSEFMFIDNSACNLASLNLPVFRRNSDEVIDKKSFKEAVRLSIYAQEALVDYSSYPSKEIAENSHKFRPLGLGYAGLSALLMEMGIPYDSEEGRSVTSAVTSLLSAYAYQTSAEIAARSGAFSEFEKNKEPMLNVMKMHRDHTKKIKRNPKIKGLDDLIDEAERIWEDVISKGEQSGFRNAQVTLLAPTGTISFMMDSDDSTGVEPLIALKSYKGLAGGGELAKDIAPCVIKGLRTLGYQGKELEGILTHIDKTGNIADAPGLKKEDYRVFQTAIGESNTVSVDGHLKMMASVQPFLSGAVSKTVNLPAGSTIEDVKKTYIEGWKLGLKSISLYIDGSKGIQPVNLAKKSNGKKELKWGEKDKPADAFHRTERFGWSVDVNGTGVHFIVGEYDNRPPTNSPGDFFAEFGSSGSPFSAAYTSWGKEASWNRQRGETVEEFIRHNRGARGTINGMTDHPFIKTCSSIEDMFAKLVQLEYLGDTSVCDVKPSDDQIRELRCNVLGKRRRARHFQSRMDFIDSAMSEGKLIEVIPLYEDEVRNGQIPVGKEFCDNCGFQTVFSGANCRKCLNCGDAGGCG
jgi:ribonucleoside-diphosphate reductase alpha chain